jgi:hypothetical protein
MSLEILKSLPGIALTVPRLMLADRIARRVESGADITTDMLLFVAWDILDGAVLRQVGLDDRPRRVLDGVIDQLSIARVGMSTYRTYPEAKPYVRTFVARAALVGAINCAHFLLTNEVTKGQIWQKSSNVAAAVFSVVAARGDEGHTRLAGKMASVITVVSGLGHLKGFGQMHNNGVREL